MGCRPRMAAQGVGVNPERWQKFKEICGEALELPEAEREAFVKERCAGDAELEAEVLRILSAPHVPDGFLKLPPRGEGNGTQGRVSFELRGLCLGDFVLDEELGRGASGIVY